jgi:hypothetical protein
MKVPAVASLRSGQYPPHVIHVKKRAERQGPEIRLLRAALKTEFFFRRQLPAVFFHEPELPTGLPDLVAVYMSRNQPKLTPERLRLTSAHIRVLHSLHLLSRASLEDLSARLAMPQRNLEKLVLNLSEAELITVRGSNLSPTGLSKAFAVKHIVAIEAKIDNWPKALEQAAANRWFASQSFILIPPSRSITKITKRAAELGVGVLVLVDNEIKQVLDPKVAPIPASYGSWLFNEWALRLKRSR